MTKVTSKSATAMLTNMKLVSDRTSGFFHTMKMRRLLPTNAASIVMAYMIVNMIASADPMFRVCWLIAGALKIPVNSLVNDKGFLRPYYTNSRHS